MNRFVFSLAVALFPAVPASADNLVFSMEATDSCLADIKTHQGWSDRCIGESAGRCMEQTEGGETTVGMPACLSAEFSEWDRRLNANYKKLMAMEVAEDAELDKLHSTAPRRAPALKEMQRAWIKLRDTQCAYVGTQWGNGSGAGPAMLGCQLSMTGQQARFLRQMMQTY